MGFKCGIVGLPNVGKSTLFNALTNSSKAQADNFPFCTIDPNIGVVPIQDERLDKLVSISKSKKKINNTISFVDIAGLVKGASKGEGLGNKFLSYIREVDAIIHVVRCFEDENITHVNNKINPLDDIEIINTELILSDLELLEKIKSGLEKKSKSGDEESVKKVAASEMLIKHLEKGNQVISFPDIDKINETIKEFNLITNKPVLYVCNVDEASISSGNQFTETLEDKFAQGVIIISADIESQIASLSTDEQKEYIKSIGLDESGLNKIIKNGYETLNLITYFTAGEKETRAWTIEKNTVAPDAAAKIHTDFKKGFIRAETIAYKDYIECQGEIKAREMGKLRSEGKEYIVQDGDVMHFLFNN